MKISRFALAWSFVVYMVFFVCSIGLADDLALRRLNSVRLSVVAPHNSEPLSFQLQNMLETKLRQVGLKVSPEATSELRLNVVWVDIDPDEKRIIGKYGTVQLSLYEPVKLVRDSRVATSAFTWEGQVVMLHGPPETFADRIRQWSSDLADEFLNKWVQARGLKVR